MEGTDGMMMVPPLKVVVSHKWWMLLATQAIEMSHGQIQAKFLQGPPKLPRTILFWPHTCLMITDVRTSAQRRRIKKWARIRARCTLIQWLIEGENSGEICEGNKILKKHVDEQTVTSLCTMHFLRPKPKAWAKRT